ncbi:hypothetical protein BJ684DRAFT_20087 [Piptocephalis cylindrospora]|uniref:Cortical protein marker for cell polarity-domain-containing protein n=1 Tax=Piptocephalis cylindrospora TaxID=1907219 RepID=A0A4P9Y443_9FUNG|nr:hypothetical protein BJ684DRAFT_20087 [Piptocephalis cylindrospora]|eukprot:RKP13422.1 hypothetical protein BJ684DRAFT_20087 [Piptocephalis cylindrospora]
MAILPSFSLLLCILFPLLVLLSLLPSIWADTSLPTLQWIKYDNFLPSDALRPPPRSEFAMGYDWRRRFLYLFGGKSASGQALDDTWVLDILHMTWTRPASAMDSRPPARYGAVAGMDQPKDQSRDSMVVALGMGLGGSYLEDVWSFDLNHQVWIKIPVNGTGPGPLYGAAGGIDTGNGAEPLQSFVVAGGDRQGGSSVSASQSAWVLTLSGNYVTNTFNGAWAQIALAKGSTQPSGLTGSASTILSNSRIAYYGGCSGASLTQCPPKLRGSPVLPGKSASGTKCVAPLTGALLSRSTRDFDPNTQETYRNLAVLFGGQGLPRVGAGPRGSLSLLDTDAGTWFPVQPAGDPVTGESPALRVGARMLPASAPTTFTAQVDAKDLFLFGGLDPTTGSAMNDLWILRMFNQPMSGTLGSEAFFPRLSPATAGNQSTILDLASGQEVITVPLPCAVIPDDVSQHGLYMTIGALLLPLAVTFARYGRPVRSAPWWWHVGWGVPYTLLLAASLGLLIHGFLIAYNMLGGDQAASGVYGHHIRVAHSIGGVILLAMSWLLSPLLLILAQTVRWVQNGLRRDKDGDAARKARRRSSVETFGTAESDEGSEGGFEVLNRPGQGAGSRDPTPGTSNYRSNPYPSGNRSASQTVESFSVLSMLTGRCSRGYWADYYGYPVIGDVPGFNEAYGYDPSRDHYDPYGPNPNYYDGAIGPGIPGRPGVPTEVLEREKRERGSLGVRVIEQIHHSLSHLVLWALHIYVLITAFTEYPGGSGLPGAYLGVIIFVYALWLLLAWFGSPRKSITSLILGRWFGGRNKDWIRAIERRKLQEKVLRQQDPLHAGLSPSLGPMSKEGGGGGVRPGTGRDSRYRDTPTSPFSIQLPASMGGRRSEDTSIGYASSRHRHHPSITSGPGEAEGNGHYRAPSDGAFRESGRTDMEGSGDEKRHQSTHYPESGQLEESDEEGEEERQRRLEEEYNGRDVMVMTIPKRRLAVVNND